MHALLVCLKNYRSKYKEHSNIMCQWYQKFILMQANIIFHKDLILKVIRCRVFLVYFSIPYDYVYYLMFFATCILHTYRLVLWRIARNAYFLHWNICWESWFAIFFTGIWDYFLLLTKNRFLKRVPSIYYLLSLSLKNANIYPISTCYSSTASKVLNKM